MDHKYPAIIGIAGVAQVGKDTFAEGCLRLFETINVPLRREAFADTLKEEIREFVFSKTAIDPLDADPAQKEIIRPLLVEYGRLMRTITEGSYWIAHISKKVEKNLKNNTITIVTDVRYPNECLWINNAGGATIHLSREGKSAANEEEQYNDPLTKKECNFQFQWKHSSEPTDLTLQTFQLLNETRILPKFT